MMLLKCTHAFVHRNATDVCNPWLLFNQNYHNKTYYYTALFRQSGVLRWCMMRNLKLILSSRDRALLHHCVPILWKIYFACIDIENAK